MRIAFSIINFLNRMTVIKIRRRFDDMGIEPKMSMPY